MAEHPPYVNREDPWPLISLEEAIDIAAARLHADRNVLRQTLDETEARREADRQERIDAPFIVDGVELKAGEWYDMTFKYGRRPHRGLFAIGPALELRYGRESEARVMQLLHYGAKPGEHVYPKPYRVTEGDGARDVQRVDPNPEQVEARTKHVERDREYEINTQRYRALRNEINEAQPEGDEDRRKENDDDA